MRALPFFVLILSSGGFPDYLATIPDDRERIPSRGKRFPVIRIFSRPSGKDSWPLETIPGRRQGFPAIGNLLPLTGKACPAAGRDSQSSGEPSRSSGIASRSPERFPGRRETLPAVGKACPASGKGSWPSGAPSRWRESSPGQRESLPGLWKGFRFIGNRLPPTGRRGEKGSLKTEKDGRPPSPRTPPSAHFEGDLISREAVCPSPIEKERTGRLRGEIGKRAPALHAFPLPPRA